MAQLGVDRLRYEYLSEQLWKYFVLADQHQVVERAGIGDDEPHAASEAGFFQVFSVAFQVVQAVRLEHIMRLQKPIERVAGAEP